MKCGEICARSARSSAWARRSSCSRTHRQLDLRGDQAGRLLHHPQLVAARAPLGAVEGDQRPGALALHGQRREHRRAQRARRIRGDQPRHDVHAVIRRAREQPREQVAGADLLASLAVDRQHGAGVGQRDRGRAGQRAQVGDRLARPSASAGRGAGAAGSRWRRAARTACRPPRVRWGGRAPGRGAARGHRQAADPPRSHERSPDCSYRRRPRSQPLAERCGTACSTVTAADQAMIDR